MLRKSPFFTWGKLTLGKQHLLILVLPLLFAIQTQAKICTSLKAFRKEVNSYGQPLCTESYRARCGWFTFKECTYYEKVPCTDMPKKNSSHVTYKIVTDCCPGYKRDESNNLTCIRNTTEITSDVSVVTLGSVTMVPGSGDTDSVNIAPNTDIDADDDSISMSHGAFAAIACGGLFIVCVTIVIVIHVRKKQLREQKKAKQTNSAESEKMLHI